MFYCVKLLVSSRLADPSPCAPTSQLTLTELLWPRRIPAERGLSRRHYGNQAHRDCTRPRPHPSHQLHKENSGIGISGRPKDVVLMADGSTAFERCLALL